ncbi:MAG: S41 family peptidase [Bacteroidales bacterium]|nr:S41 family peptidase [Bacteroidales bacterium]
MKHLIRTTFILAALLCALRSYSQGNLPQPKVNQTVSINNTRLNNESVKFKQILYVLANAYVDTLSIDRVSEEAMSHLMRQLDPHSVYISAKDVKEMEEPLLGKFEGIGIEYALIRDTITVQSVIPGSPSEKVGLRAGDKINSVDGEVISGTKLTQMRVLKYLRGDKGTKVRVGVIRRGEKERELVITRDKIPLNTVSSAYEIRPGIMYIRVSSFGAQTYNEFMTPLEGKVIKGLIIDLRGNGGGYLHTALRLVNEFMEKGQLILFSEGRAVERTDDYADGTGKLQNVQVAVLIDENSASASEILSGAIQDWDRGILIGRRSFGKGLVQQEFPLQDGSRVRITVARYHTPSGRVIQSPYKMGQADEYYRKFYERYLTGESFNADSIKINDSLKFKTLKLGRTVYGGGGIMPDVYIPMDTSYYSKSFLAAVNKGILSDFVGIYADSHRKEFERKYGTFSASQSEEINDRVYSNFVDNFEVSDKYLKEFLDYAKQNKIEFTEEELQRSGEKLKDYLKGLIVRNLYGLDYYIRYDNLTDDEVRFAIDSLESPDNLE